MPRPSAYSRTRRLVMQATMAGVLLASVGVAALLARVREQRWGVTLLPTPHLTPQLAMHLPRGWRVDESLPGEGPLTVTARQDWRGGEGVRVLEVVQIPVVAGVDATRLMGEYRETQAGVPGEGGGAGGGEGVRARGGAGGAAPVPGGWGGRGGAGEQTPRGAGGVRGGVPAGGGGGGRRLGRGPAPGRGRRGGAVGSAHPAASR